MEYVNAKIFIIEDNEVVMKSIIRSISDTFINSTIFAYKSVESALGNVDKRPDYILLDHFLENMNGIESIPVFREFLPGAKILVISSQNDIQTFEDAYSNGASEYFRKDGLFMHNIIEYLKRDLQTNRTKTFQSILNVFRSKTVTTKVNRSIYIYDDNISTSYFTQHILQFETFNTVLLFNNITSFLNQVKRLKPDVAILECSEDGDVKTRDLIEELKRTESEIMIVVFSDQPDVKKATELLNAGAAHYLIKSKKNILRLKALVK